MTHKNAYPEVPLMPFEKLSEVIAEYERVANPHNVAAYVNRAYDEEGFSSLKGAALEDWQKSYPRVADEDIASLAAAHKEARLTLARKLTLEDAPDVLDSLLVVHMAERSRQLSSLYSVPPPALEVPYGKTHGWYATGVLAMAKLTGESYRILEAQPPNFCYYEVSPEQELSDIFPELKQAGSSGAEHAAERRQNNCGNR